MKFIPNSYQSDGSGETPEDSMRKYAKVVAYLVQRHALYQADVLLKSGSLLAPELAEFLTSLNGVYESTSMHHTPEQGIQSQLVSYVNEHMFEHISLQSVSEHFYLSQSQIRRLFQRATGSPLWEYVKIKRLLAARAMIQRGENANTACHTCGFSDYSAFFRAYRSYFGHSPREDAPEN